MRFARAAGRRRGARRGPRGSPRPSRSRAVRTRASRPPSRPSSAAAVVKGPPARRRPRPGPRSAQRPRRPATRPRRRAGPARRRRRRPGRQGVALSQRLAEALAQLRATGQRAAMKPSRWARRSAGGPLTSARRSGEKTATGGRLRASVAGSAGLPSSRWRRPSPRLTEASRSALDPVLVADRRFGPGEGAAERDHVAAVRRFGTSGRSGRSRAPRAGSSCRRRWARPG